MMKRNRLYTVKKGNMFALGDQMFNSQLSRPTVSPYVDWSNPTQRDAIGSSAGLVNGFSNMANATNPFNNSSTITAQPAKGSALTGILGGIGGTVGNMLGSAIGGGYSTGGVGEGVTNVGNIVGGAMQMIPGVGTLAGTAVQFASGLVGGVINRAFGSKMNDENIAKVESGIANTRDSANALSGASDSSSLLAAAGNIDMGSDFSNGYIGSDGWFSSKAKRKANELRKKQEAARSYAAHGLMTNANNVDTFLDDNVMGNFAAFGGILPQGDTWGTVDEPNTGAIEYGFMSDWLNNKRKKVEDKYKDNFFVSRPQGALFDFGGNLQSHGSDFGTGLVHIDAGGSHSENPYDGVQMGVDPEGTPNLVEEGETIFNEYVFSNRIFADGGTLEKFHLPRKAKLTFADISKKLEKEIAERPNDVISKAGFKAQMQTLQEQQERQKQEMEAERAKAAFEALSPEEQVAVMDNAARQEAMAEEAAQQEAMQEAAVAQQPTQQDAEMAMVGQEPTGEAVGTVEEEPVMAEGGHLYAGGGDLALKWLKENNDLHLSDNELKSIASAMGKYIEKNYSNLSPDSINMKSVYSKFFKGWSMTPDAYGQNYRDMRNMGIPKSTALKLLKSRKSWSSVSNENDKKWEDIADKWEPASTASATKTSSYKYAAPLNEYKMTNGKRVIYEHNGIAYPTAEAANKAAGRQKYAVHKDDVQKQAALVATQDTSTNENPMTEAPTQEVQRSSSVNDTSSRNNSVENKGDIVAHKYDWYRNGSDGYSEPTGFKVGSNGLIRQEDYTREYKDLVDKLTADDIRKWAADHPQDPSLLSFLAKGNKLEDLTDDQWRKGATDGKYGFMHHVSDQILQDRNGSPADVSYNNEEAMRAKQEALYGSTPKESTGILLLDEDGKYTPIDAATDDMELIQDIPEQYGNMKVYKRKPAENAADAASNGKEIVPIHKADWLRYAGLFGPAVGLGMQMAGVGRPDTSALDGVLESYDRAGTRVADWKPIGNYLTYRPMDIWFEQNRLNASNRATDRAILNSTSPSRMAGLLASGYNDQMASGDLYRKALEYNDAKRQQVAEFNRGTDMFNAQAYNQNQQFNANALNHSSQYRAGLAAQVANQKMNADAGWYNSLYGNVGGLFKGLADLGRENYQYNQMVDLLGTGALPGVGDKQLVKAGYYRYAKEGGKIKRKKNKKGLTY